MLKNAAVRFAALAVALLLHSPPAHALQCTWTRHEVEGPPPRHSPGIAYDSRRGVTVLFGGITGRRAGAQLYGDTWEWDGQSWKLVATTGPTARIGHAMVYDEARGVVVLFGGNDGTYQSDTWEWDGQGWRRVAQTGPSPRSRVGLAYDPQREVVVLFGGIPRDFDDTWEWDGTEWRRISTEAGPSGRSRVAMEYDPNREAVVLFGGRLPDGQPTGDTWEWDGSRWKLIAETGPHARARHRMVYEPALGTLMAGGVAYGGDREMLVLSEGQWVQLADWLSDQEPETRELSGAEAQEAPVEQGSARSGGQAGADMSERSGGGGRARGTGGAASSGRGGGGSRGSAPGEGPSPRVYYGMVYEAARGSTLFFGGWDGSRPLNDTWEFRCE